MAYNKGNSPIASVIIPARNAEGTIGDQLEALCAQDAEIPFEVIVVVNGSTDDTESKALRYADRLDLRVIASAPGICNARNAGAAAARSQILLFCDADDAVHPDWLGLMAGAIGDRHGIVGGGLAHRRFNTDELLALNGIPTDEERPAAPHVREPQLDTFDDDRGVCGANFGVWRPDYWRARGMDASYVGGVEETDFCYRARTLGIPVTECSEALTEYRLRADARSAFRQQRGYAVNRILFNTRVTAPTPAGFPHLPYGRPMSLKASLVGTVKYALAAARLHQSQQQQLEALYHLGGELGSLEGHVRYRVMGRPPARLLADPVPPEHASGR